MRTIVFNIVDRTHVGASFRQVLRKVRSRMKVEVRHDAKLRDARKEAYRLALERHAENRRLYRNVMRGV